MTYAERRTYAHLVVVNEAGMGVQVDGTPAGDSRVRGGTDGPALTGAQRAWALESRPSTTPRRGLSVGRIVEAGIELAAHDGVGGLSMAAVAARLGAGTMSLYRHVASRGELLALMVDRALGAPVARPAGLAWRAALSGWAADLRAVYRRHPWVLQVPISGPPVLPHDVEHLESALQALAGTGLSEHDKLSAVLLVSGFVRNEATLRESVAPSAAGPVMASYGATLAALVDLTRFPALQRALDSGALGGDDLDGEFRFGLDRLLDGLDVLVRAAAAPAGPNTHRTKPKHPTAAERSSSRGH